MMLTGYIIIAAFCLFTAVWIIFYQKRQGLRVLMYHKVSDNNSDFLTVTKKQLETHLEYLRRKGYSCISMSECLMNIEKGTPFPAKPVLITFDDGYENNYTHAYPVLKQYGVRAAMFLVPSFIGKTIPYDGLLQTFADMTQLKEMASIMEYGWHSFKHDSYAELSPDAVDDDLISCVKAMKNASPEMLPCLAYPYGAYPKQDPALKKALSDVFVKHGIGAAFRIGNRVNSLPIKNRFLIQRLDIRGNDPLWKFKIKLAFGKII